MTSKQLREACLNAKEFSTEILHWIQNENLWNIWVPKEFGGLEFTLTEGLKQLKELAKIDGSLGWTITLCSGANFFIGNLQKDVATELFSKNNVCLGGSGGVFGTAEKSGNQYLLNGKWRYATGSHYLSDFTLNAHIIENGKPLLNKDGSPYIRSFIVPKEKVKIIEDWDAMGLVATVTNSFCIEQVECDEKYSFRYADVFLPQALYQIDFSTFADLTLWVNYIGMAAHFLERITTDFPNLSATPLQQVISTANNDVFTIASDLESKLKNHILLSDENVHEIHLKAAKSVKSITQEIIKIYPFLGIRGSSIHKPINQLFRDYFTATQHPIFVKG
ncbi:MAG TPA: hypothetical protein VKX31_06535 [Brumimicrobium sp.]|nr:hypothetical protein [Brumimicrobium sp.]